MNFIKGLPQTTKKYDAIMIVVEKLHKVDHFLAVKLTYTTSDVAQFFYKRSCEVAWSVQQNYLRYRC